MHSSSKYNVSIYYYYYKLNSWIHRKVNRLNKSHCNHLHHLTGHTTNWHIIIMPMLMKTKIWWRDSLVKLPRKLPRVATCYVAILLLLQAQLFRTSGWMQALQFDGYAFNKSTWLLESSTSYFVNKTFINK